jgi:hypothetical protein
MTATAAWAPGAAIRRARRVIVPASLADLYGPADVLDLPARLYWSGPGMGGRFDLAVPDQAAIAYEAVLEAARVLDDITAHLDAGLLAALWPTLGMRTATRRAWEAAFPELAAASAPTAA